MNFAGDTTATLFDCLFDGMVASNSVGGVIAVAADKALGTQVFVRKSTFREAEAGFYGAVLYNAMGLVEIVDSTILEDTMTYQDGVVFNAGGTTTCISGCGEGEYGDCEAIDPDTIQQDGIPQCYSCNISACFNCPRGTFNAGTGGVTADACSLCARGWFTDTPGQEECQVCPAGSYTTTVIDNCAAGDTCEPWQQESDGSSGQGWYPLNDAEQMGATHCEPCPAGFFSASEGSTSCESCTSGHYAPAGWASECLKCEVGKYSDFSETADFHEGCKDCEPGTFYGYEAGVTCSDCQSGRYSNTEVGVVECTDCAVGRYADFEASSSCLLCQPGQYSDSLAQTSCKSCAPGSFSNTDSVAHPNMDGCEECPPGKHSSTDQGSCTECIAGRFSTGICEGGTWNSDQNICEGGEYFGVAQCDACPAGQISSAAASSCTACESGRYAPPHATGSTYCKECELGKYSNPTLAGEDAVFMGSDKCIQCVLGQVSDHQGGNDENANSYQGATQCVGCTAGKYAGLEGMYECDDCEPGTATDKDGASRCNACLSGTFSDKGATTCTGCAAGYYAEGEQTSACTQCDKGRSSGEGKAECDKCDPGKFSDFGQAVCDECVPGRYSEQEAFECIDCEIGKKAPVNLDENGIHRGAPECEKCEASHTSRLGSAECDVCTGGYYYDGRRRDLIQVRTGGRVGGWAGGPQPGEANQAAPRPRPAEQIRAQQ